MSLGDRLYRCGRYQDFHQRELSLQGGHNGESQSLVCQSLQMLPLVENTANSSRHGFLYDIEDMTGSVELGGLDG